MPRLFLLSLLAVASANVYKEPPPTFAASEFTAWQKREVAGSRRAEVDVEFTAADGSADYVKLVRLDLVGDTKQRGFAHGALLADRIKSFAEVELDQFIRDEVKSFHFDTSKMPAALVKIFAELDKVAVAAAPKVFRRAMSWVWETEFEHTPQYIKDEIAAMAEGMCSTLGEQCSVPDWTATLQQVNMFPELIRMACTAFGAWGPAKTTGTGLIQLRALDFGTGPWARNTVVSVHRGDPSDPDHAFVTVSFPGFAGVITGVSQNGIGISEKVWMTYDTPDLQPGTFHGEADVFVLRDILQFSKSKAQAESMLAAKKRTFAIWIGVGDFASSTFDLIGYQEGAAVPYTDVTMPSMTGQPYIPNVCYVDKHPQPSHDGINGTLPVALQDFYGKIDLFSVKQIIQAHETGDVHVAAYDFSENKLQMAIGRTNSDGQYGPEGGDMNVWFAYNRPWLLWNLSDLWAGK